MMNTFPFIAVFLFLAAGCSALPKNDAQLRSESESGRAKTPVQVAAEKETRPIEQEKGVATLAALNSHRAAAIQEYLACPTRPLTPEIRAALQSGKPVLGMTKHEVRISYGDPKSAMCYASDDGIIDRWTYTHAKSYTPVFLTFRDNLLSAWQD